MDESCTFLGHCKKAKKSCVYFSTFPLFVHFLYWIRSQLAYSFLNCTYIILINLQAVTGGKKTVTSGGTFYQLPPDKENTGLLAGFFLQLYSLEVKPLRLCLVPDCGYCSGKCFSAPHPSLPMVSIHGKYIYVTGSTG